MVEVRPVLPSRPDPLPDEFIKAPDDFLESFALLDRYAVQLQLWEAWAAEVWNLINEKEK
ncbi:MAG: hypothetical protein AAF975_06275 [Spirochaetota bacterium]